MPPSPLAPDDSRLAISVGDMEGHDATIARRRICLVAAPMTIGSRREPALTQGGVHVELDSIAYIRFADSRDTQCRLKP